MNFANGIIHVRRSLYSGSFVSPQSKRSVRKVVMTPKLACVLKKHKLESPGNGLSLHCLRHTFVTWRIEHGLSGKGDNLVRVQQAAGHADIQTTMRYTHIKMSPEKNILALVK